MSESSGPIRQGMVQAPDGTFRRMAGTAEGAVLSADFFLGVAKGNVTGHAFRIIRGHKTDIDALDGFEDIWEGDGSMTHPTGAEAMTFVSTSDEDGAGTSTGALTVLVEYLDATYAYQTHTVTLNGTTGVTAGIPAMLRVISMVVLTCGSAGGNVGDITATAATSGLLNEIDAGDSISHSSHYTVPLGKTAHLIKVEFNASKTGGNSPLVEFVGQARTSATGPWINLFDRKMDVALTNDITVDVPVLTQFGAKTDVRLRVDTDTANTDARSRAYILEVDD